MVIIMYLVGRFTDSEIFKLSGKISKKVTAINVPEAKAKKYGRAFLNFIANVPPINVDANVINANPTISQSMTYDYCIDTYYFLV
jgi:hypothetical protein